MFDFLKWNRVEQSEPVEFIPAIQIHPRSTLFIECTPNDPNTSSNIIVNTYISKTNRTLLQTRIRWSRFKLITQSQHSVQQLTAITGNAYRCQPADLGSYIRAKITSFDVSCSGEGEVTIGPIRLDPTIKPLVEGSLYSKQLRSQIKVMQKNVSQQVDMVLTQDHIRMNQINTTQELKMGYDIGEPRIELNPKDPTKIFLRFEQDSRNMVRNWLNQIFYEGNSKFNDNESMRSHNSGSSKSKLFKSLHCPNKIEVVFLSRHCRDQFLFSLKAFVSKQTMKNTIVMQNIEHVQELKTSADVQKFFHFLSLKYEIFRLSQLAKEFKNDRDHKIKDINDLEESIGEMTLMYTKIIEQKGKLSQIDFNQSYSEISLKREEIMGRKQMREVMNENEQLKDRVRQLNEELELNKFFQKENNNSMLFNQTNNPFMKKNNLGDSIYNPITAQQIDDDPNNSRFQKGNMLELAKSYMDLMKEHEKLKVEKKHHGANISRDMVDLLESLHEEDEDPSKTIKKQKVQIQTLEEQIKNFKIKNEELTNELKKTKTQPRLNHSIAHQLNQSRNTSALNDSNVYTNKQGASFYSINSSHINQSMTSQAGILMLEQKLMEIQQTNRKILGENDRLRKERNNYRSLYESLSQQKKIEENRISSSHLQSNRTQRQLDNSNLFDRDNFDKVREEKEVLVNENISLKKKIESVTAEAKKMGNNSLIEKKCESLIQENNKLRQQNQNLWKQNEQLRKQIEENKFKNQNEHSQPIAQSQGQVNRLKKINQQLLEEIKMLKIEIQKKSEPLYNSRIVQLQNQVNFFKKQGDYNHDFEASTKQLLQEVSTLQKTIEKMKSQSADKDSKLASQQNLIQRLMNQQQDERASISGKDKSYSQNRNDISQNTEKLRKKIRELQEEIILMRRSADALNRSKDISMDMQEYNQQRIQMMQKERQALLQQNERLSRMCEKYAKDAREGIKWKKQYLQAVKTNKQQQLDE